MHNGFLNRCAQNYICCLGEIILKKAKLLLAFILISIVFIVIGEFYGMYLNNAEYEFPSMMMHFQEGESAHSKIQIADKYAKKNNVKLFMVNGTIKNSALYIKTVYTSNDVKSFLETNAKMKSGLNKSIFWGKTKIIYEPLLEYENTNLYADVFVIGGDRNVAGFMDDFAQFADNPSHGEPIGDKTIYVNIFWSVVFSIILLMTIFEIVLLKRQVSVQMIMGERLNQVVLKHMGKDFAAYIVIMLLSICMLQPFTNVLYDFKYTVILFFAFVIINSLLYLSFYFMDIRKNTISKTKMKSTLRICYVYKFVSVLGCIIALVLCFQSVWQWIGYEKYNDFLSSFKSYDMLEINTPFDITDTSDDNADKTISSEVYFNALKIIKYKLMQIWI